MAFNRKQKQEEETPELSVSKAELLGREYTLMMLLTDALRIGYYHGGECYFDKPIFKKYISNKFAMQPNPDPNPTTPYVHLRLEGLKSEDIDRLKKAYRKVRSKHIEDTKTKLLSLLSTRYSRVIADLTTRHKQGIDIDTELTELILKTLISNYKRNNISGFSIYGATNQEEQEIMMYVRSVFRTRMASKH